jgi:hypothetical protein
MHSESKSWKLPIKFEHIEIRPNRSPHKNLSIPINNKDINLK